MATAESLRDRKKAATRQALHEVALQLALREGLDNVTVEQIADEVGVSRRTFSNYFANKEEAILHAERERTRKLLDLLRGRPPGEKAWLALRRSALQLYGEKSTPDLARIEQFRLLMRHPSLMARQAADHYALAREIAAVLQEREPGMTHEVARLTATTFMTVLRTAGTLWFEQGGKEPLVDVINRALDRVHIA
jgi:AcrR family transcriptional regulator